jgi:enamine deaminase RidA (YjgF/YER057c/UK114 family)
LRENIVSGSPLEAEIGLSRAVRVGRFLAVAGTTPIGDDGRTVGPEDVSAHTRRCIDIAERAIKSAGLSLDTVIRTRILLRDTSRWREAA